MNIKDFDKYIDKKILSRGLHYYNRGYIISLEYDDDEYEWIAEVEGNDDYHVTVKLNESGDILGTSCDCPYDYGYYCKHQAAVFYSLRNFFETTAETKGSSNTAKSTKSTKINFEEMLKKVEKDELISFLLDYSKSNKKFKNEFKLVFADKFIDKSNISQYAKSLIKSSFAGLSRNDYINYRDASKVVEGAEKVLKMAENTESIYSAADLYLIVIEEMLSASNIYYDHDGYMYGVAEQAAELLSGLFAEFEEDCEELKNSFELIMSKLSNTKIYDNHTYLQLNILEIFTPLCDIKYIRESVEKHLKILNGLNKSEYEKKVIQKLQYSIILKCEDKETARNFINNNLDNDKFREIAIEQAITEKDYNSAIKLCLDGEKKDIRYSGLVKKWKELRYKIYENRGDTDNQKKLAYEFTSDGNFDYYIKLRDLYAESSEDTGEWHAIFDNILESVTLPYHKDIYTKILIHENMKPELLEYCKNYSRYITSYYSHLLPDYKDEVNEIFIEYLTQTASESSDRSSYRAVCKLIKEYAKVCGNKNALDIIQDFKSLYTKRPAFIDELGKIELK